MPMHLRGTAPAFPRAGCRLLSIRPLLAAAAAALLLTACGLPGSGGSKSETSADAHACTAPKPEESTAATEQITPQAADQVVRQLWQQWDRDAQKASYLDCASETETVEGPSFATSVASDQVNAALNRPARNRSNPIQGLNVYVPRLTQYPLWFAAIARTDDVDQDTGKVTDKIVYRFMILTRTSQESRWKEYVETDVPGGDPKVARDDEGYADGPTGTPIIDPEALPEAYVSYLQSGGSEHASLFAPGDKTDQMAKGTVSTSDDRNTFQTDGERMFVLPMQDASRMVVFTGAWNVRLTATGGKCYSQDTKRTKEPVYFPPGDWKQVDINTVMVRVAFVPNRTGQVQLAGDDGLTLSKGSNAC